MGKNGNLEQHQPPQLAGAFRKENRMGAYVEKELARDFLMSSVLDEKEMRSVLFMVKMGWMSSAGEEIEEKTDWWLFKKAFSNTGDKI